MSYKTQPRLFAPLLFWWFLLVPALSFGQGAVIFGPETFTRGAGSPVTVTRTFEAPDPSLTYTLRVQNGQDGAGRVSSARLSINGTQILRPSDFSQQVAFIEREIGLEQMNTLEVRLTSAPSSFLVVTIIAPEELPLHPTVQWTPSSLYASLAAGESTTTIASFVPTANATNVSVGVLPELAPYVSVSPTSFASVAKGVSYPVTVTMTAPVDMVVGTYDGSIQLRQETRTLTELLAVDLTFSPIPLPPDPGEAGKLTIEGIDSDGDGVRDDVQRWIGFTAYQSESAHAALSQSAKAMQEFLLAENSDEILAAAHKQNDAIECLYFVRGDRNDAHEALLRLRAEVLNTEERSRVYIANQVPLDNHIFGTHVDDWQYKCGLDPWTLDIEARN